MDEELDPADFEVHFSPGDLPEEEASKTWTDAEEHEAKIRHLVDVI